MTIELDCNSVAEPFAKNWIELAFIVALLYISLTLLCDIFVMHSTFLLAVHYLLS